MPERSTGVPRGGVSAVETPNVELMLMARSFLGGLTEAMAEPVIRRFAAMTRELFFREGAVIYEEGETTGHVYFVIDGRVRLETEDREPWRFGRYSAFGILDATLERPHKRTATAENDVRVLAVRADDWFGLIEENFELTRLALARNARGLWQRALEAPDAAFEGGPPPAQGAGGVSQSLVVARRAERRGALNPFERLLALRLSPPFARARMQPLIRLAQGGEVAFLEEGELLFRRDEPTDALFFVASGAVAVEREDPRIVGTFGVGQLVGSYGSLTLDVHAFDAYALSDAVVLEVHLDELYDVMEDHFDVVRSLQAYLALERERLQVVKVPEALEHPSLPPHLGKRMAR